MKTYLRHKIHNVIDVKGLTALEYLDFKGKYKNYTEKHDFWELCYVEKGSVILLLDNEKFTLQEDEVILIAPNQLHSYTTCFAGENKAFVVCFESFSYALKTLDGITFKLDTHLKDCIYKIISEYKHTFYMNENDHLTVLSAPNFGGEQAILLQLEYLIICLLRKLSTEKNSEVVFLNDDDFYSKLSDVIIKYFEENITSKITLDDICTKVNYSRSFLCKTFKDQTGESMFSYFNKLKIEEAKKLLSETDYSITAISKELKFTDVKYFGALFKKIVGLSPSEYKKTSFKKY